MGGEVIQLHSKQRLSEARRINHYMHTEKFLDIVGTFAKHNVALLEKMVQIGKLDDILSFVSSLLEQQLEHQTVYQLRNRARSFGIPKYWSMSKSELLVRILDVTTARTDADSDGTTSDKEDEDSEPSPS